MPFGLPDEPIPPAKDEVGIRVHLYGLDRLAKAVHATTTASPSAPSSSTRGRLTGAMSAQGYPELGGSHVGYLAWQSIAWPIDATRYVQPGSVADAKWSYATRFRVCLPMNWDFIEGVPMSDASGGYFGCDRVGCKGCRTCLACLAMRRTNRPVRPVSCDRIQIDSDIRCDLDRSTVLRRDSILGPDGFLLRLATQRRCTDIARDRCGLQRALGSEVGHAANDGELIDDSSRHDGRRAQGRRQVYEDGMFEAFRSPVTMLLHR